VIPLLTPHPSLSSAEVYNPLPAGRGEWVFIHRLSAEE
jgi:hypothetical protein